MKIAKQRRLPLLPRWRKSGLRLGRKLTEDDLIDALNVIWANPEPPPSDICIAGQHFRVQH